MASEELERLRVEARARHRAATRKVSRLKTGRGVNISGTRADPRRDPSRIKSYNSRQLKAYIRDLNQFTDRRVQFVADTRGRPMQASLWRQYKGLEQQYNRVVGERFSRVSDVFLPTSGMTLGERMEMTRPEHPQALSPAVNAPYRPPARQPTNIASERALRQLVRDMKERLKPGHFRKLTKDARQQYEQMTHLTRQSDLDKKVRALTDEQFNVLWNFTPFATAESLKYERAKDLLAGKDKPWQSDVIRNAQESANELVAWASQLDLGG